MNPHLRELLISQDNVVALWQLDPGQRRAATRAAREGHWRRLTKRCFLAAPCKPSKQQLVWAGLLHGGPRACLAGRTALTLQGWQQELITPIEVIVPHHVQPPPAPKWLRIHRTTTELAHLAAAHAAARARSDREAMFIVIFTLQQRLVSPDRLSRTASERPKLPRHRLITEVTAEYLDGAQSLNELDFAAICRRFGILRRIDVEFRSASGRRIRVEIDGLHHLNPAYYFADLLRHNQIALADPGVTLRISTGHLKHQPQPFLADLRQALEDTRSRYAA